MPNTDLTPHLIFFIHLFLALIFPVLLVHHCFDEKKKLLFVINLSSPFFKIHLEEDNQNKRMLPSACSVTVALGKLTTLGFNVLICKVKIISVSVSRVT
jgi:hypothetical protein